MVYHGCCVWVFGLKMDRITTASAPASCLLWVSAEVSQNVERSGTGTGTGQAFLFPNSDRINPWLLRSSTSQRSTYSQIAVRHASTYGRQINDC